MSAQKKNQDAIRCYLFKGDDEIAKRKELDKLLKSLVSEDSADFDLEELQADSATAGRIVTGLNVPPFSSDRRVVLVKYANKIPEAEQKALAVALDKTPESGCLILVNPAAEKSDGKVKKGSEVIGELSRAVRKHGKVNDFGGLRGKQAHSNARQTALSAFSDTGRKISSAALDLLVRRVGTDSSIITTEAQKVIDYTEGQDTISPMDVETATIETPEEKIFKLIDAVSAKNGSQALMLLKELFHSGDDPRGQALKTLSMIARQFRLLWQAKLLAAARVRSFSKSDVPERIKLALPESTNILDAVGRQAWKGEVYARQARQFSVEELVECLETTAKADLMLKGIEGDIQDPQLVMELLVLELAGSDTHSARKQG